jgi:uncharacterized protein YjbI with pentapeptide repeats
MKKDFEKQSGRSPTVEEPALISGRVSFSGRKLDSFRPGSSGLSMGLLSRCALTRPDLRNVSAIRTDFSGSRISEGDASGGCFVASTWKNSRVEKTVFRRCDFRSADLTAANFRFCDFAGSDLSAVSGAFIEFEECDLSAADLSGADLRFAKFSNCRLPKATLRGAVLTNCLWEGGSLAEAYLEGTDWTKAQLQGTDLEGVSVSGARFWSVKGLSPEQRQRFAASADVGSPAEKMLGRFLSFSKKETRGMS